MSVWISSSVSNDIAIFVSIRVISIPLLVSLSTSASNFVWSGVSDIISFSALLKML